MVEIDGLVVEWSQQHLPSIGAGCWSDPRFHLTVGDGIAWTAQAADASYDVVIVDGSDPAGPAEGLFNRAFYENCFKALRPDGLLVQQSESPLALMDLIRDMIGAMSDAGFRGFRTLPFPQPCYPTGWWSCTIAAKNGRDLAAFRSDDAAAKTFTTEYYNAGVHYGALLQPELLRRALKQS